MNHQLNAFHCFNYIPSWSRKEVNVTMQINKKIHVLHENEGGRQNIEPKMKKTHVSHCSLQNKLTF